MKHQNLCLYFMMNVFCLALIACGPYDEPTRHEPTPNTRIPSSNPDSNKNSDDSNSSNQNSTPDPQPGDQNNSNVNTPGHEDPSDSFTASIETTSIQIVDPIDTVVIDKVVSPQTAWVAIFSDDDAQLLGYATVDQGENTMLSILLSRYLLHEETLRVALFERNEEDESFDDAAATAIHHEEQPVEAVFQVLYEPTLYPVLTADDVIEISESELRTITLESVITPADGRVAVYKDQSMSSPMLAYALVSKGENLSVEIELPEDDHITESTTLYVALQLIVGETLVFKGSAVSQSIEFQLSTASGLSLSVSNQTLSDLTTVVVVDHVELSEPGWVVVYADDVGSLGSILGKRSLSAGPHNQVHVALARPALDGESLHVVLHANHDDLDQFDYPAGSDVPLENGSGDVISASFLATVPVELADIRITLKVAGGSYVVESVEPAHFDDIIVQYSATNTELWLYKDWRFELINLASASHPLEIVDTLHDATDILLAQQAGSGSREHNYLVSFERLSNGVRFTFSSPLYQDTKLVYRCTLHPSTMSAYIVSQEPPNL